MSTVCSSGSSRMTQNQHTYFLDELSLHSKTTVARRWDSSTAASRRSTRRRFGGRMCRQIGAMSILWLLSLATTRYWKSSANRMRNRQEKAELADQEQVFFESCFVYIWLCLVLEALLNADLRFRNNCLRLPTSPTKADLSINLLLHINCREKEFWNCKMSRLRRRSQKATAAPPDGRNKSTYTTSGRNGSKKANRVLHWKSWTIVHRRMRDLFLYRQSSTRLYRASIGFTILQHRDWMARILRTLSVSSSESSPINRLFSCGRSEIRSVSSRLSEFRPISIFWTFGQSTRKIDPNRMTDDVENEKVVEGVVGND